MIPRLNQCFICQRWTLEEIMQAVEVPSQGMEFVKKLICPFCMNPISAEIQKLKEEKKNGLKQRAKDFS